ncbi:MAG: TonB-dependent receptor [Undibacterium sp.]|nr:TonB-dependent receptor [Opitutaceae bacterium]
MTPPSALCATGKALGPFILLVILLLSAPQIFSAPDPSPRQFDLPRGAAAETLKRFAAQANREIMFPAEPVAGVTTNPVKGTFAPREALDRMVARTGLLIVEDPYSGAIMVGAGTPADPLNPSRLEKKPTNPVEMKRTQATTLIGSLIALALAPAHAADTRPGQTPAEETIELNPFTVRESSNVGYQMSESTAGGRVRVSTFETTQPVNVVSRAFINDVGTGQILDALKYVSGVTQSTQSVGADRMTIRGFQISNTNLIDGFATGGNNHQDAAIFDRFEVVKGPNAIISPAGAPGGTVNLVSKSPLLGKNSTTAEAEIGLYDSNRGFLDANRVLTKDLAVRLVVAGQYDDGYYHNYEHNLALLGGLTWRFGSSSNLTVKYIYSRTNVQNFVGLPINPTADTSTSNPQIYPGLKRDANIFNSDDLRFSRLNTIEGLYTQKVLEGLSTRIAAQYNYENSYFNQFDTQLTGPAQGDYNPLTGAWVYGVIFNKSAPYNITGPAATPTSTYQRGTSGPQQGFGHVYRNAFQNDWVYDYKNTAVSTQTSAGYAFNASHSPHDLSLFLIRSTANPLNGVDTFDIFGPYRAPISGTIAGRGYRNNASSSTTTKQLYANEVVKLFKDRLILNGGLSQSWFKYHLIDNVTPARTYDTSVKGKLQKTYGAVFEPMATTALYYGHSEVTNFSSAGLPPAPQTQDSKSDEVGVRQKFFEGKVLASVAYFNTTQNNYSVPNPLNLDPSRIGLPPLPGLFSDRTAKGWEFEANASITKELSVVANYTFFKNRDKNDVVFRGTAEKSGAFWAKYEFKAGDLKGLGVGVGINHLDRRPGDAPRAGFTSASTATNQIYNQPTYWIPARTVADVILSYRFNSHWNTRLIVNNVLNKKYIESALNRQELVLGGNTNYRAQVTYSF